jgi:hypothetical protein
MFDIIKNDLITLKYLPNLTEFKLETVNNIHALDHMICLKNQSIVWDFWNKFRVSPRVSFIFICQNLLSRSEFKGISDLLTKASSRYIAPGQHLSNWKHKLFLKSFRVQLREGPAKPQVAHPLIQIFWLLLNVWRLNNADNEVKYFLELLPFYFL